MPMLLCICERCAYQFATEVIASKQSVNQSVRLSSIKSTVQSCRIMLSVYEDQANRIIRLYGTILFKSINQYIVMQSNEIDT
jgi:hypothetical protein